MNHGDTWGNTRSFVLLLLGVQVVVVVLAWALNPLGPKSETEYAMLVAADLVAFALISYIGRLNGMGAVHRDGYLVAGSVAVLLFKFLLLLA